MLHRSLAKVNLYLRVGPRRADGFHGLVSWFCSVGLFDELTLAPGRPGVMEMTCDNDQVPCDSRNLVIKAAGLLAERCANPVGVQVHLTKRIPMGGGLGGGSSNAATALLGLNELWGRRIDPRELMELAGKLGSDVPFFLHLPSAICRGRGELITPVAAPAPKAILLFLLKIAMPTAAVYRRFDELALGSDLAQVERELPDVSLPTRELLGVLVNDLERAAFSISPELGEMRGRAEQLAGRPVRMSGSGSTLFTLYDSAAEAQVAAGRIGKALGVAGIACTLGEDRA